MPPIRIMNVSARLNIGGVAIHVVLLTAKFAPPVYESLCICGSIEAGEGDMTYYARQHGVEPIVVPELGRSLSPHRDLITIWKLYRLIRKHKPDIVHTHTAKAGFVGRVAAWLARVPVIVHTFHGHTFSGYFSPAKTQLFLWLERLTARMSSKIITLTETLRQELANKYRVVGVDRIIVLPLILDLSAFEGVQRKSGLFRELWNIPADAPLIGVTGRLVPIKNHALFLRAAVRVREKLPDACFVIVGDGELRAEIEAQVDVLGLRDAMIFTGWQQELSPIYADIDVSVISSDNEGTPVSIIESLVAGCPVVSTAVGGVPDMLENGRFGALTTPGDAQALAGAIVDVVKSPPDVGMARAVMLERYGMDGVVKRIEALYRGLLKR